MGYGPVEGGAADVPAPGREVDIGVTSGLLLQPRSRKKVKKMIKQDFGRINNLLS